MIIEMKEKFIKKLKLNSNINKFVFAKTLFSLSKNPTEKFLDLVANVLMNRFVYEAEISDEIPNIVALLTSFECWNDSKSMDKIDIYNLCFKKCLIIASKVLVGELNENFSSILYFQKNVKKNLLTNNIAPRFVENGFSFFDVYV